MGVWCEFARNRLVEKTDAVLILNIEAAQMIRREQLDQMLRGVLFTLDFDRLMGVRFTAICKPRVDDRFWPETGPSQIHVSARTVQRS